MTNADKIRSMNDEELVEFIRKWVVCWELCAYKRESGRCMLPADKDCADGYLAWLQQEHKE